MNVVDLAVQCVNSINGSTVVGSKMEDASILVVTPKGWKAPPKFPRGQIVQWKEDGSRVRYLPAMKVLAWLAAQDLVKIASKETK